MSAILAWILALLASMNGGSLDGISNGANPRDGAPGAAGRQHPVPTSLASPPPSLPVPPGASGNLPISNGL